MCCFFLVTKKKIFQNHQELDFAALSEEFSILIPNVPSLAEPKLPVFPYRTEICVTQMAKIVVLFLTNGVVREVALLVSFVLGNPAHLCLCESGGPGEIEERIIRAKGFLICDNIHEFIDCCEYILTPHSLV